ncbi:MAG TPA: phosphotransferase family protein [Phenylobacterium sp.]|uniref:phosphotransferase family protein n=1 Tax=Phenylobacterium sp. TaxID=1871053 RepID=UPI002B4655CC|nr:phosphotransferase family protein [Phenylobacterium sp.]HKR89609.1 phosphotransferase family protein [Phenylobacterium sp.]
METGIDLGRLMAWMDEQGIGAGAIERAKLLAGGTQNLLFQFERGGQCYVLRRPPLHLRKDSNDTMRREARMLAALAGTAVPHPRLIAACPDETALGAAFYLMEGVDGFNAGNGLPPLHANSELIRHRMGLATVEGIASLGALDYRGLGLDHFGRAENFLERQVARWKGQLASYSQFADWPGPGGIPGVERVAGWLDQHRPSTFQPGIIHGDYQLTNVMFRHDGPELAAIVDWELTTIGDPLLDLGWLLATWQDEAEGQQQGLNIQPWRGFPTRQELVDHYRHRSHRDLSAIDWYAVLACYKLGLILEGTYARACAGMATHAVGKRLHAHAIHLFERALRWIA